MNRHQIGRSQTQHGVDFFVRDMTLRQIGGALSRIEALLQHEKVGAESKQAAFELFMTGIREAILAAGKSIRVTHNVSWIKIESLVNGHRIYVSKGKLSVGRIDSTLSPESIEGAVVPGFHNGKIASWLPASPERVSEAIGLLTAGRDRIRPLE